MAKGKYPRSLAKYIRAQKAMIRRRTEDSAKREKLINEIIERVTPLSKNK